MHARPGDRIVVRGHRVADADRRCLILDVPGGGDRPPYHVRWGDAGPESLFFPGPDATVLHTDREPA
ncbi:MAG: DUF1918 domain-containing protein [Actinomycetota bacterium]|nr:DUF1918 domain-containing protein [Actinomycetota bacterium]